MIGIRLTEKEFQQQVVELLKINGWRHYHTFDSRRSEPGFPDIIAIRGRRLLALELKTDKGQLTESQKEWLLAFSQVMVAEAAVVRASDNVGELLAMLTEQPDGLPF